MTLTLILIRHAKSSWDDPFSDDHARVLNARGRAAASAIGVWLSESGHLPDVVLCSDAVRTRETAALILPQLAPEPQLKLMPALYHADAEKMLELIRKQTERCVAIIGHNPGIGTLANGLVKRRPKNPRFGDYPTCATSVITFDTDTWADVAPNTGTCTRFVVPADLPSAGA